MWGGKKDGSANRKSVTKYKKQAKILGDWSPKKEQRNKNKQGRVKNKGEIHKKNQGGSEGIQSSITTKDTYVLIAGTCEYGT